jgi:PAS domain-containing protein
MSEPHDHIEGFFLAHDAFQTLFNSAPLPMWVYDRDNLKFLAVNDAAVLLYEHSREQFLSKTIFDIISASRAPALNTVTPMSTTTFTPMAPGKVTPTMTGIMIMGTATTTIITRAQRIVSLN